MYRLISQIIFLAVDLLIYASFTTGFSNKDSSHIRFNDPVGCPIEYSKDTSLVTQPETNFFYFGHVAESQCDAYGADWKDSLNLEPKEYFVYPSTIRTCLVSGVWSSPPPICLRKATQLHGKIDIQPHNPPRSLNSTVSEDGWSKIGNASAQCYGSSRTHSVASSHYFEYDFGAPYYLSFLMLSAHAKVANVEIFAKKTSMIGQELSEEARNFMRGHYNEWRKTFHSESSRCVVTELSVYAEFLRVRYSIEQEAETRKDSQMATAKFFAFHSQASEDCPKLPQIPNTQLLQTVNGTVYEYYCPASNVLVDLVTQKVATDGVLRCHLGNWIPHPYLACLSLNRNDETSPLGLQNTGWNWFSFIAGILTVMIPLAVGLALCYGKKIRRLVVRRQRRNSQPSDIINCVMEEQKLQLSQMEDDDRQRTKSPTSQPRRLS